ncbi:MAG: hypothetical protein AB7I29_14580, partial [Geobacter sp.]
VKFIAVPVGTATGVEWRGVVARHGDQGYKIFWCASALAEMAAKAAAGGAIVYPSGMAKSPVDLCGELGVEAAWAEEHLFPTLIRLGEGHADPETGAWVCTSPMFSRTLEWQNSTVKALPEPVQPQKGGRKSIFTRTLGEAEYKAWQRNCVLPDGVFLQKNCPKKAKGKCPEKSGNCPLLSGNVRKLSGNCPETKRDNFRTDGVEDAEIVDEKKCPEIPNIKEVKGNKKTTTETKPDTPVVVFCQDQLPQNQKAAEALLSQLCEAERSGALLDLLMQCLGKGATERDLLTKINKAKLKNGFNPGKYLRRDLEAYRDGTDWDAAEKEAERQKIEQREAYESSQRVEAERQAAEAEEAQKELLARQKRFFSLPEPERQVLEDLARRELAEWNRPNPDLNGLVSMALDILDGLRQPQVLSAP